MFLYVYKHKTRSFYIHENSSVYRLSGECILRCFPFVQIMIPCNLDADLKLFWNRQFREYCWSTDAVMGCFEASEDLSDLSSQGTLRVEWRLHVGRGLRASGNCPSPNEMKLSALVNEARRQSKLGTQRLIACATGRVFRGVKDPPSPA